MPKGRAQQRLSSDRRTGKESVKSFQQRIQRLRTLKRFW